MSTSKDIETTEDDVKRGSTSPQLMMQNEAEAEDDYEESRQIQNHLENLVKSIDEATDTTQKRDVVFWTQQQKIAHEILQSLEHLERTKPVEQQEVLKKYDALKSCAEIQLQDVRIFSSHFDKAVTKYGINLRGHNLIKKIVDGEEKYCNMMHKQIRLKTAYIRTTLHSLRSAHKGEIRINERLKQSEAEGLQIKIQQIVNKHQVQDNAVRRLKYMVNDCRFKIDQQRAILQERIAEKRQTVTELRREQTMTRQLTHEHQLTEQRVDQVQRAIALVQHKRASYTVPSVLEYAATNERVDRLRRQAREYQRKLDIAQMMRRNQRAGEGVEPNREMQPIATIENID